MNANEIRTDELQPGDRIWHWGSMTRFTVDSVTRSVVDYRFQTPGSNLLESGMEIVGHDEAGEPVYFTAAQSCPWSRDIPAAPPAPAPEPVDYASRFAALDSDVLFDVEEQGDCEDARRYVESLLVVLAEWRTRVVGLLAETPAEWAVPEAGAYQRALNRTREAWLQYGFRWQDGPALPWPFDLPESPQVGASSGSPEVVARITAAGRRSLIVREVAA